MIRRPVPAVLLAVLLLLVVAGCGATQESGPAEGGSTTGSSTTAESTTTEQSAESTATGSGSPSIPGFDGWRTVNQAAVDLGQTQSGFGMTLNRKAEWSGASRGVLFYTTVDGDFRLSGTVRTSRTSDSSQPPGGDGTTQLAGLMVHADGSTASWLLLEVGGGPNGLVTGSDSTVDGKGRLATSGWDDTDADLKLCRVGSEFSLWKRAADSDDDWTEVGRVERKDLAGTVEAGASLSASATPDLTGLFDNLTLEPMDPGESC